MKCGYCHKNFTVHKTIIDLGNRRFSKELKKEVLYCPFCGKGLT